MAHIGVCAFVKEKWKPDIFRRMNITGNHYIKGNSRLRQQLYIFSHMWKQPWILCVHVCIDVYIFVANESRKEIMRGEGWDLEGGRK